LHSPAGISGRKAATDVDVAGHTVPRGSFVVYSAYVTHRQPELWPDPRAFRPERWIDASGAVVEPAPYTFVPFGGGYRRCIGFAMATLEAKIIVAETLRRSRLHLERTEIAAHGIATVAPKGGVPATVVEKLDRDPVPPQASIR
jgi:cytochrome P450